jgi:hypothetical protein
MKPFLIIFCVFFLWMPPYGTSQTKIYFRQPKKSDADLKPYDMAAVKVFLIIEKDTIQVSQVDTNQFIVDDNVYRKALSSKDSLVIVHFKTLDRSFFVPMEKGLFDFRAVEELGFIFYRKSRYRGVNNGYVLINQAISRPITATIVKNK